MKIGKLLFICSILWWGSVGSKNVSAQRVTHEKIYAEAGTYAEFGYTRSYLGTFSAGASIFQTSWFMFSGEANVYKFWSNNYRSIGWGYSSLGIGIRPAVKIYPLKRDKYSIFTEVKGGIIYMLPEYANAAINYTLLTSVGGEWNIGENNMLYGGIGYTHYSNGRKWGEAKNPTWDGVGPHIGIMHTLK